MFISSLRNGNAFSVVDCATYLNAADFNSNLQGATFRLSVFIMLTMPSIA